MLRQRFAQSYSQIRDKDEKQTTAGIRSHEAGWRPTLASGAGVLACCLFINIVFLIWARTRPPPSGDVGEDNDVRTLFAGDCDQATSIKTWSHFAINISSTLILATSTVCMQCLSAPTRDEVDEAHRKGTWMDIGILSFRNLSRISRRRAVLYIILLVSSMPIHLLYNSVILSTTGAYDSLAVLATSKLVSDASVNSTEISSLYKAYNSSTFRTPVSEGYFPGQSLYNQLSPNFPPPPTKDQFSDAITSLASKSSGAVQNLTASDCFSRFRTNSITSSPNVILVTSMTPDSQFKGSKITVALGQPQWSCGKPEWMYNSTDAFFGACNLQDINKNNPTKDAGKNRETPLPTGYWTVDYCLVESDTAGQHCTIVFSTGLIGAVIFANFVKLAAMVYTLAFLDFRPLITVGDAIASFMGRPDTFTRGLAPHSEASVKRSYRTELARVLSTEDVKNKKLSPFIHGGPEPHKKLMHVDNFGLKKFRWASAASVSRWVFTFTLCIIVEATGATLCGVAATSDQFGQVWNQALGAISPEYSSSASSLGLTFLGEIVLTNLPQFIISSVYVTYMGLLTTMLSAKELCGYTNQAKSLRVSPLRRGYQRSSYFLQVPYKYSLPVMLAMILLHWLVSQALFTIRISEYSIGGSLTNPKFIDSIGFSVRGILGAVICGGFIILFPIVLGFRRLSWGMPLINNNSLALSIACHPHPDEPEDGHERPLKYGLVQSQDLDDQGLPKWTRIGFSAGEVQRLKGGEDLSRTRCLSTVLFPHVKPKYQCTIDAPLPLMYDKIRNMF